MQRLLLIRHGRTEATRRALFPTTTGAHPVLGCERLDARGEESVLRLGGYLPRSDRCWSSCAERSLQTARALTGTEPVSKPELAEADFGRWTGLSLDEVHLRWPTELAEWLHDPSKAPYGGESLDAVRERAGRVLAEARESPGTTLAVTHGGWIKAALLQVLELPNLAVWNLDVAPASATELHPQPRGGGWRVTRLNWTPSL